MPETRDLNWSMPAGSGERWAEDFSTAAAEEILAERMPDVAYVPLDLGGPSHRAVAAGGGSDAVRDWPTKNASRCSIESVHALITVGESDFSDRWRSRGPRGRMPACAGVFGST